MEGAMWWSPRSGVGQVLQSEAQRLLTGYREHLRSPDGTLLRGVGAGSLSSTVTARTASSVRASYGPGSTSTTVPAPGVAQEWFPLVLADVAGMQPLPEG